MLSFLFNKKTMVVFGIFLGFSLETQTKSEQNIVLERVMDGSLEREKAVFKRAFTKAYEGIPLETLKVASLESFLEAAFEDEPVDLNKPDSQVVCFVAKKDNEIIGVIFYEPSKEDKSVVYVRQLAVDPKEQRNGVGSKLMSTIKQTLPSATKQVLATRKVNKQARDFYTKLGFTECENVPHGLNPERYVGFEKNLK